MTFWEYKAVSTKDRDLQALLDEHSRDGWRLVQTYEVMGYTTRLIFEREKPTPENG